MDVITKLIPIVNATGVPILIIGMFVMIRAFRQQVETYRGSADDYKQLVTMLKDENERLRTALKNCDDSYQKTMERVRELNERSARVASALLSEAGRSATGDAETQSQIGRAVMMISQLLSELSQMENSLRGIPIRISEDLLDSFFGRIRRIAESESLIQNPHAQWALTVVLGAPFGGMVPDRLKAPAHAEASQTDNASSDPTLTSPDQIRG